MLIYTSPSQTRVTWRDKKDGGCESALQNAVGVYRGAMFLTNCSAVWYYIASQGVDLLLLHLMYNSEQVLSKEHYTVKLLKSEVGFLIKSCTIVSSNLHQCNWRISNDYHQSTKKRIPNTLCRSYKLCISVV